MSEQIEQAARAMADDWNPDRDPILTAMFRDYANTLATAGLLTPSDTFASTKPSDAEHLLSVVETIKETGGSVQVRGVLITPCDTYGQPLNTRPDADVAERIARALEEAAEKHPNPIVRLNLSDAADIARSHVTPPEVEYGALRKSDGWSTAMPGASLEWASAQVPTDSILTLVQRRPGIAPGPWVEITPTPPAAATEFVSGYTSHGHRIAGVVQVGRPTSVARCGGPGVCTVCSLEAVAATSEGDGR